MVNIDNLSGAARQRSCGCVFLVLALARRAPPRRWRLSPAQPTRPAQRCS